MAGISEGVRALPSFSQLLRELEESVRRVQSALCSADGEQLGPEKEQVRVHAPSLVPDLQEARGRLAIIGKQMAEVADTLEKIKDTL